MKIILFFLIFRIWVNPEAVRQGGFLKVNIEEHIPEYILFLTDTLAYFKENGKIQAIGVVPMNIKIGKYYIKTEDDSVCIEVNSGEFIEEAITLPDKMVKLGKEDAQRVGEERERIRKILKIRTADKLWKGDFDIPVEGEITGPFGAYRLLNKSVHSRHRGIDIRASYREEIRASNRGNIVIAENRYLAGKTVLIDHGMGFYTFYCHLDTMYVDRNSIVDKGEVIGLMGKTGRATGVHLHFGTYLYSHPFNPTSFANL